MCILRKNEVESMKYVLYADGACSGNPGPGGYAYELWQDEAREGNELLTGCGSSPATTNNIMELRAAIAALEDILASDMVPGHILMRLDSEYVLKGMFEWLENWKNRGWKTAAKKPVANGDQWRQIDELHTQLRARGFVLEPDWVKGHAGTFGNERVDEIAQRCAAGARAPEPDMQTGTPSSSDDGINGMQVELMTTILHFWKDGHHSVRDVIGQIRANAIALGIR